MTDKVKNAAPEILEVIQNSQKILLHCHVNPDPDSVGGVLAMMYFLKGLNKEVTVIIGDSKKPDDMKALPGYEQILQKSYFDVDPKNFDLFLILDSSSLGMISEQKEIVFPEGLKTVIIDHHGTNSGFAQINLIDSTYPANCQIIYDLIKTWRTKITPEIAANLIAGIYADTGNLKYRGVTPETLEAVAELIKIYPDFTNILFELENSNSPANLAFMTLGLSSIELYFNNHVAISAMSYQSLKEKGIDNAHINRGVISESLRSVIGWDITVAMTEIDPEHSKLSFRTRNSDKYDISRVAKALDGGGHPGAGGGHIYKPFEEAKKELLSAIEKTYPELGKP